MEETKTRSAIIVGSTGLVGESLLMKLISKNIYEKVMTVGRKPMNTINSHHRHYLIDFSRLTEVNFLFEADDLFLCLGTTRSAAGSKEKFYQVDYGYNSKIAQLFASKGGKRIFLISSEGADSTSSIFYNRVKGELENFVQSLELNRHYIFRPSLLLGERREFRLGEKIAQGVFSSINKVLHPITGKYIGTKVKDLADTIYFYAINDEESRVISNSEILKVARNVK
jgi:uncharacterized protein YbjT (DUF2867 family)